MKLRTNFEPIDEFLFQWSPKIFYTKYIILNIHTDWDPEATKYNLLLLGTFGGFVELCWQKILSKLRFSLYEIVVVLDVHLL